MEPQDVQGEESCRQGGAPQALGPRWDGQCVFSVLDVTKHHDREAFEKQEKCVLSQFWRPEVGNRGVSRARLPP